MAKIAKVAATTAAGNGTPAPAPKGVRYAPRTWQGSSVITLVVTANPKKGASHARYALYATGLTVAQYQKAVVAGGYGNTTKATADLRWDVQRGYITIAPQA